MKPLDTQIAEGLAGAAPATFPTADVDAAVAQAVSWIAPTWPLDRFIAVNPLWGRREQSLPNVAAGLRSLSGARLLMPRAWYRAEREAGRLTDEDLRDALRQAGDPMGVEEALRLLGGDEPSMPRRARVVDVLDDARDLRHEMAWSDFVRNGISQFCAAFFDDGQAVLEPDREPGLWLSWLRHARADKGPRLLMGMRSYAALAERLPRTSREMLRTGLQDLGVPESEWSSYLASLLLDVNGWASWCMYRRWTARLGAEEDDAIVDLLAMRLAWEWLLHTSGGEALGRVWELAMGRWTECDVLANASQADDWLFQAAVENHWRRNVVRDLPRGLQRSRPEAVAVQAAFCIDVRSEVFRRALEAESGGVQTLGFAGFFGLPVDYRPLGTAGSRPQLPGLLAPAMRVRDTGAPAEEATRRAGRLGEGQAESALRTGALSTFTFVEGLGPAYAWKLLKSGLAKVRPRAIDDEGLSARGTSMRKPRLTAHANGTAVTVDERADLAAGILRGMSLTRGFARLVLFTGHGSSTVNNPHAAGLDCGACCGQTGEVNARATAALFNDPEVRAALVARGIEIPDTTHFVAGLHDTTTDEVTLFELDELPETHLEDLAELRRWLLGASRRARRERAAGLGLADLDDVDLKDAVVERSRDWSQVRPEWGLADNAAFIVAPREHTRHLNLAGRSFLHDYRWEEDEGFAVLEQIMTAPMVVTHWINFQYYASTVDNDHYGSGNKVLHNVVGGHLGVFEGNGGDLRTGLSLQSVHDGERWRHTPLRLSVFIEAPRDAIEAVIEKHADVRALVEKGWIQLLALDPADGGVYARRDRVWQAR